MMTSYIKEIYAVMQPRYSFSPFFRKKLLEPGSTLKITRVSLIPDLRKTSAPRRIKFLKKYKYFL